VRGSSFSGTPSLLVLLRVAERVMESVAEARWVGVRCSFRRVEGGIEPQRRRKKYLLLGVLLDVFFGKCRV